MIDQAHRDHHPGLRADYVLVDAPFKISDWSGGRLADDKRGVSGIPSPSDANFDRLRQVLHNLGPRGQTGNLLANRSTLLDQTADVNVRGHSRNRN